MLTHCNHLHETPLVRERSTVQSCAAAPFYGAFRARRGEHRSTTVRTQSERVNDDSSKTVHFVRRPFGCSVTALTGLRHSLYREPNRAGHPTPQWVRVGRALILPIRVRPLIMHKPRAVEIIEGHPSSEPHTAVIGVVGIRP